MNKFKNLTPADVLERKGNIPSLSIVGASGAGKTTAVTNLLNPKIATYTSIGIGEKSQTTNFASNFILDARIDQDNAFAILIKQKRLDSKLITGKIFEAVSDEFSDNDYDIEDTIYSLRDSDWTQGFLEPKDASYHLDSIESELDIEKLTELIKVVLGNFNKEDFEQKVAERKKVLGKKAPKAKILRKAVFSDYALDPKFNTDVIEWVGNIEGIIRKELKNMFEGKEPFNQVLSYTVENMGQDILKEIYNPQKAYSLVIDNIDIACRPRDEAIEIMKRRDPDIPLRMMLVDTIGVSQEGVDEDSLTMGIDRALNRFVNGIVLIINLEEREDVIRDIFDGLNEKLSKLKNNSDVYILFSKGDKLVETKIDKRKTSLKISQEDYDRDIETVLGEISEIIKEYSKSIHSNILGVRWQSLSYKDEKIDPRILAIKNSKLSEDEKMEKMNYFLPEGLFEFVIDAVYEQQLKMLPENVKPILVTVNNIKESPLKATILQDKLKDILDSIVFNLSEDSSVVGQYRGIPDEKATYHHSSVITYYHKLIDGIGHTTRAAVYDNFSVNMKALISNNLEKFNLNLEEILSRVALDISTDNLEDKEVYSIIRKIENKNDVTSSQVERELLKNKYLGLINDKLYWISSQVISQVSMCASYENEYIKSQIDSIYLDSRLSYTDTFKQMQSKYKEIFASDDFKKILCDEIGTIITNVINSGFVVI